MPQARWLWCPWPGRRFCPTGRGQRRCSLRWAVARGSASGPRARRPRPEGFETLTSGSTGPPRRILRSVESWTASFAVNAGLFGIGPGLRLAVPGRLSQSLALYGALEGLCLGAEVHLLDGLRPDRQVAALAARRVQVLYATPAQLRLMAEAGGRLDDLRLVLVGGAKLDAALRAALLAMAPGAALREFYGAAEASFITLAGPQTPDDSVGTPYPGVEVAVRDDQGHGVAPGSVGTLWVRSPYLFTGYAGADPGGRALGRWLVERRRDGGAGGMAFSISPGGRGAW